MATCFYQGVERQLIRPGHRPPDGLVELQLEWTAPSPEWWRRQRLKPGASSEIHEPAMVRPARFDLHENPTVGLDTSFVSLRFYLPQAALDEMADEAGIPRVKRLQTPQFGRRDPVMYGFAQTLAGAMASPGDGSAMFCEHIALALFAYIARAYGGVAITPISRGGLAPWQLRRAHDFIDANLRADASISDVAEQCGLSASYFSRAFKRETGFSPHRWVMKRRVERAKQLLEEPRLKLVDIAEMCGFVDQSHFARVFSKSENCTPGRWRRLHHS